MVAVKKRIRVAVADKGGKMATKKGRKRKEVVHRDRNVV